MNDKKTAVMAKGAPWFDRKDVFVSGREGYHTYRIPAMVVTPNGAVLAFCEGRKYETSDAGKIDLLLKRSLDGGETWEAMQVLVEDGDMTCGNPCPVVDRDTGIVWLPFQKNPYHQSTPRTVWLTHSKDDGASWAETQEITHEVKLPGWEWYAGGPGHGIQLKSGRLIVPCNHSCPEIRTPHILYSDDHGKTWCPGGNLRLPTGESVGSESVALETEDGALYLNARNRFPGTPIDMFGIGRARRVFAWSHDGGKTFSDADWDDLLIESVCQAGLARFTSAALHGRNRVLFSNPAACDRRRLSVKLSYDECRTWALSKVIDEGRVAYSDLAVTGDMTIHCLYERGENSPHERLTLARFNLEWLTDGKDSLSPL